MYSTLIKSKALLSMINSKVPLAILDASYNIPGMTTGDPKTEHFSQRIPGAKFFEIDEIADKSSGFPHMMPSDALFISCMKKLRIKNDKNLLVLYDKTGMISSPRAWYTFKIFGKQNIAVLDGGFPKWISENNPTESGNYEIYQSESGQNDSDYAFKQDLSRVKDFEKMKEISEKIVKGIEKKMQILDARSAGRFNGTAADPRKGLRSGSIPGSLNSFFQAVYNPDKTLKSPEELKEMYTKLGISYDEGTNVINSCGSGLTACINLLGLEVSGKKNISLYDGSWMEWGSKVPA